MKRQRASYQVVPYPRIRRWMVDMFRSVRQKPIAHHLIEADVTEARARLRGRQATTGEALSFTAFLGACVAKAMDEHRAVQAYRLGGKRLILFDDVDVWTPIEHDIAGQKQVMPTIIRAAQRKTVPEIHKEIRAAQRQDMANAMKRLRYRPAPLFRAYFWLFSWRGRRDPRVWKLAVGTVGITAVGMFADGPGWGIPIPAPVPMVTVGGIGRKPAPADGRMEPREYLCLTISVDQDLVDSALAAAFTSRLKELIESAYGLDGATGEPAEAAPEVSQQADSLQSARRSARNDRTFPVLPVPLSSS